MKGVLFAVALATILLASTSTTFPLQAETPKGERSDLNLTFYSNSDAAWTALVNGEVDVIQWSLTEAQKEAAEADPNIQLCRVDENDIFEFDLNNNYTIQSYPGVRSPTNEVRVRQAIAHLINKSYIISNILGDFGTRIDVPIAASQSGWMNTSVIYPNYPYEYDPEAAAQLLSDTGFADTDGNGWLNYPADWDGAPGADTTVYPLYTIIRYDHSDRLSAGQYLVNQLEVTLAGTSIGAGFKTLVPGIRVMNPRPPNPAASRNYHIYTGGWSLGRMPTYLYFIFHSEFWYPYGPNFVTGMNSSNLPNYPDVDEAVRHIWDASSVEDARWWCQRFSMLHSKYCINIPLWSYVDYYAYRKELVGVVNMDGVGIENAYTFLDAYCVDGSPVRLGVTAGPDKLNILYSMWYMDYAFLNRVYTSAINFQPYNMVVEQPWVIQDWEVGEYDDNGTTKTVVTYYIRKDVGIVAPITGDFVRYWDADDFEFSIWYSYAFDDSWWWGYVMDVRYTKVLDVNGDGWKELQVYFDEHSMWFFTSPIEPLLTRDELIDPLNAQTTDFWTQVGTSEHTLTYDVVEVVSADLDGTPLVEGVDYVVRGGYDLGARKVFVPLRDLTGTVTITYWYPDIPAYGFYLGGLPWQQTMYSLGTHYPVSMTTDPPGIGDTIVLRKNPAFFLETPILGEIDWVWKWVGTTKPRSGYYKIEIYDVVKATGAYCTRGDGIFNPKFFPGADIDPTDLCHIGIYDLVTITGKYAKTFGAPP